ncbi:MAG: pyruvate dehydrogenase (acetyl-transferring) E1 component subunit alpha [Pirellulales bacterium]|nr:pyruvate dehydrogenase (acetyl-transferring) E1 component subunit alpha [Pirellulales bacterium]
MSAPEATHRPGQALLSGLPREALLERLREMLRIRRFEERCAELYTQGKIHGFLHLCIGEEAVAVGAMRALRPEDNVVSTYREHGHALARGISAAAVMAEMFGKANGCSRGRGGSMHLFDAQHRFFGGHAIVGGGLPIAVGLALAARMRQEARVTCCFFGDGAVAEGVFHESLNLAALWRLPVLFLCENNLYAMGTHITRHQSQIDIARKAAAYGLPGQAVDGMAVLEVEEAARAAVAAVRAGEGPRLLEARTYRFRAHSMYDPELYRSREEVAQWKQRDPIDLLAGALRQADLLDDAALAQLEGEVAAEIDLAVAAAEAGPWEPVQDLLKDVHSPRFA